MTPAEEIKKVMHDVCEMYGIKREELVSPKRSPYLVRARAEAYNRLRNFGLTSVHIGKLFGREHSSVLHSYKKFGNTVNV